MDDWFWEWSRAVEATRQEVEKFFHDTVETADEFADVMLQITETVVEQMQEAIAVEIEQFIDQLDRWLPPPTHIALGIEMYWDEDLPWVETVKPTGDRHPACRGCQHYHGRVYNSELLVCGMHPYGWDGKDCPDWQER
ncbi:MAG: hypothetical protein VKK04_19820 [Synechococcales bacterium]|nr:hypothetical protein [Synechococcales bacterium]